jgi:hypothetical protein
MSIVSWQMFESEGSPCPSITLLDLTYQVGTNLVVGVGQDITIGANFSNSISGGVAPASLSVTSGSLPGGCTFNYNASKTVWRIQYNGSATFGSYTFELGGTDANGCAITPRSYTIEVWVQKSVTPGVIAGGGVTSFPVTVSEISGVYGTAATLAKIEFGIVYPDLTNIGCYIESPDTIPVDSLFSAGWDSIGMLMIGADLTGCVINNGTLGVYPSTSTGSAPYTGNWNDTNLGELGNYFNDNFTGDTMNGTWTARFETVGADGYVNSIKFYFKPL